MIILLRLFDIIHQTLLSYTSLGRCEPEMKIKSCLFNTIRGRQLQLLCDTFVISKYTFGSFLAFILD